MLRTWPRPACRHLWKFSPGRAAQKAAPTCAPFPTESHRAGGQDGTAVITQQARLSCAQEVPREDRTGSWRMLKYQQSPSWVQARSGLTLVVWLSPDSSVTFLHLSDCDSMNGGEEPPTSDS